MKERFCNESSLLVYSYYSYGFYGLLGIRDFVLKRTFVGICKLFLFLILMTSFCVAVFQVTLFKSLGDLMGGSSLFKIAFILFLALLFVIGIWEIIDVLRLTRKAFKTKYKVRSWLSEKSKMIFLFLTWASFLGVPWFLLNNRNLGIIKIFLFLISIAFLIKGDLSKAMITFIIGILFDIFLGVIPCFMGKLQTGEGRIISNVQEEEDFIKEKGGLPSEKSKIITYLLLVLFGQWGVHDFYVGQFQRGVLKLVLLVSSLVIAHVQMVIENKDIFFNYYILLFLIINFLIKVLLFIDITNLFLCHYKDHENKILIFKKNYESRN
jgi:hypothetical protein